MTQAPPILVPPPVRPEGIRPAAWAGLAALQAVVVGKTPELMTEEEFGQSAFGSVASMGVEVALPWHLRSAHRSYVAGALQARKPVLKAAADEFARDGMTLPAGYQDDGNGVYVWQQDGSQALPPRVWAQ